MRFWYWYKEKSFILKISGGFILGIAVGLLFGESADVLAPFGTLFMNLLKMIVVPLILLTLIVSVNNSNPKELGRIGGKIFPYYLLTTAAAVLLGIGIAKWLNPGAGLSMPANTEIEVPEAPSTIDVLLDIVPTNIFQSLANGDILSIVFLALVTGFSISFMRHAKDEKMKRFGVLLSDISEAGSEVTFRILQGILQYAPIGVMGITASAIGNQGFQTLYSLGKYVIASYVGVGIQIFIIFPVLLWIFRVPAVRFFKNISEAIMTAFVTSSSLGTLPVTLRSAKKAGINDRVANFTLPIGATVNMNGSAIHFGVGVIFAANIVGYDLSIGMIISIILTGTLAAVGTAGVPGAGLIGMSIVFTQAGLPIEIVGLTAGVNVITDMIFTTCNVTGDLVGAGIVNKSEEKHLGAQV
ncbi:dicarboxylate/amino acid:cation symporter [Virgibacillus sp. 179-BFC.A HS]|uniref:Dicarboxylate/amino acid:cation symporter n=1 Tax=Tigheibacillus jepli TaxID=3035914 RepID=A0ABU5CIH9_9BACI|nr:dicarboxylate/amino acid:cation symporter [Virgibacillus sp. 179-BFC.A HS]MDY0406146.1 dicarboxylate/amino acid:cation symporter [Virgibacillus sp. 179-BFC.A HS]